MFKFLVSKASSIFFSFFFWCEINSSIGVQKCSSNDNIGGITYMVVVKTLEMTSSKKVIS